MAEPPMGNTRGTQQPRSVSTKQRRIAELARKHPERAFISLNHYLDEEWLIEAHARVRKTSAPGVDGMTAQRYERDLRGNLAGLLARMKTGRYRAPPVRRVYIPKDNGGRRPLGLPTFEDKIAQRAIVMLLEPIYEQDFQNCSFGFRPGRSAHQALECLRDNIMERNGRWVLDLDLSNYFGSIHHGHLRAALDKRVRDGVIRRLIDKWLEAGVLEDGRLRRNEVGTQQGGVASPLLANVFLHYVLDEWFRWAVIPRMRGQSSMVRYADDVVMAFEDRDDSERVRRVLDKRLAKYGLSLNPDKTRVVDFRFVRERDKRAGQHTGSSFEFLGFTHYWRRSRRGHWVVLRKTAKKRLVRSLWSVHLFCRRNRHLPIQDQHRRLSVMMRGHYSYFGITGNSRGIRNYAHRVGRIWHKWLNRRSGRKDLTWERFNRLLRRFPLPPPRIVHAYYGST